MMTKQSIQNDTYNTIKEINSMYKGYKYINALYNLSLTFLGSILLYDIYKMHIGEDTVKSIIGYSSWIVATIIIKMVTSRVRRLECKDKIFNLAIDYYKDVYDYIEDIKIENISYVDIVYISSVYERCSELKILDEAQLDNIRNIIEDLNNKFEL